MNIENQTLVVLYIYMVFNGLGLIHYAQVEPDPSRRSILDPCY